MRPSRSLARCFLGMSNSRAQLARMMPDAFPIFFAGRQPYAGQASVIPEIARGQNVLFAAPTASGKTEAAVAPLYQRHVSFRRGALSTVYVAPTKALVNDLYERLVTYLGIKHPGMIARYTGDRHEYSRAEGAFCVLVTPEALDPSAQGPAFARRCALVVVDEYICSMARRAVSSCDMSSLGSAVLPSRRARSATTSRSSA